MKKNVGGIDKVARIVIGALLIVLAMTGTVGLWGWIGVVPLATGLFNYSGPRKQDTGLRYTEAGFEGTRDVEAKT